MLSLMFCLQSLFTNAEGQPINWTFEVQSASATEATVFFMASLGRGWHLYSQILPEGGPLKTSFIFGASKSFELIGNVVEPKPIISYEKYFDMNVGYFEHAVTFKQQIKLNDDRAVVNGTVEFMICSDRQCLPPQKVEFSVTVD